MGMEILVSLGRAAFIPFANCAMQNRTPITTQRRWWDVLQPTLDAAAVMASLSIVEWCSGGSADEISIAVGLIAVVVFLLSSQLTGFHRRSDVGAPDREITQLVATWTMTVMAMAVLAFVTRYGHHFSRSTILIWIVLAPALVGLGRMCQRMIQHGFLRRGLGVRRVAIAGLNDLGRQTHRNIDSDPSLGLRMVGFFDDRIEARTQNGEDSDDGETLTGSLDDLVSSRHVAEKSTRS